MSKYYENVGTNRTRLFNVKDYKTASPSVLSRLIDDQKYEVLRREGFSENETTFGSKNQFKRYAVDFLSIDKIILKESEEIFEIIFNKANLKLNFLPDKLSTNRILKNIIREVRTSSITRDEVERMGIENLPEKIHDWIIKVRDKHGYREEKSKPIESNTVNPNENHDDDDDHYENGKFDDFKSWFLNKIKNTRLIPNRVKQWISYQIEKYNYFELDNKAQKLKHDISETKNYIEIKKLLETYEKENHNRPKEEKMKFAKYIVRNPKIAIMTKRKAKYHCQLCGELGFKKRNGERYAEVHHVDELGETGLDLPSNMICVCPRCHRIIHYGSSEEVKKICRNKV